MKTKILTNITKLIYTSKTLLHTNANGNLCQVKIVSFIISLKLRSS